MATRIELSGFKELERSFDNSPANLLKASQAAAKKAASKTSKGIKNKTPQRWKPLTKAKVKKTRNGQIVSTIGYYGAKQDPRNRTEVGDWFKAYWKNYGTLTKRDPSHQFDTKVKPSHTSNARRRRNNVGQPAENFFERASANWEETYYNEFTKALDDQGEKIWK